jgi:hypothetical protein
MEKIGFFLIINPAFLSLLLMLTALRGGAIHHGLTWNME